MNIYTCTDHEGHYGVGVASVVVAPNKKAAIKLLDEELKENGLKTWKEHPYSLVKLKIDIASAHVLNNGDY